jgi:molecular chaperone DnaJ
MVAGAVLRIGDNGGRMARAADYYALLGVDRNADVETIKRAFRGLAREVHPDVSDEPEAADRFQELARAYQVLTAPTARLLYDHVGYRGPGNGGFDGGGRVVGEVVVARPQAKRGGRQTVRVARVETCPVCAGDGPAAGETRRCPTCGGSGFGKRAADASFGRLLQFDDCADCAGFGRLLEEFCRECGGEGRLAGERELEVDVPPRARDGDFVALPDGESVRVRVQPLVDEPRLVRYGAAAALAVAVAFLVFLLFFG